MCRINVAAASKPYPSACLTPLAASLPPKVRTASCAGTACVNSFGDEQLAVDMVADKLLFDALRFSVRSGGRTGLNQG